MSRRRNAARDAEGKRIVCELTERDALEHPGRDGGAQPGIEQQGDPIVAAGLLELTGCQQRVAEMEIDLRMGLERGGAPVGRDGFLGPPCQQEQRAARQRHLDGHRVRFTGAAQGREAVGQHALDRPRPGPRRGHGERLDLVDQLAGEQPATQAEALQDEPRQQQPEQRPDQDAAPHVTASAAAARSTQARNSSAGKATSATRNGKSTRQSTPRAARAPAAKAPSALRARCGAPPSGPPLSARTWDGPPPAGARGMPESAATRRSLAADAVTTASAQARASRPGTPRSAPTSSGSSWALTKFCCSPERKTAPRSSRASLAGTNSARNAPWPTPAHGCSSSIQSAARQPSRRPVSTWFHSPRRARLTFSATRPRRAGTAATAPAARRTAAAQAPASQRRPAPPRRNVPNQKVKLPSSSATSAASVWVTAMA